MNDIFKKKKRRKSVKTANPENYKDKNHAFNVAEAIKYNLEKSIILYNLRYWLDKNKANNKHIYQSEVDDNYYVWTYNSGIAFEELFPYMKSKSILKWLDELKKDGVILTGNFNKVKYDRTNWYTIKDEYFIKKGEKSISTTESSISPTEKWNSPTEKWNSPTEKSITPTEQPIPYINIYKQNINTDIVSATAEDKKESFISDKKNISNSSETKISQNSNLKNNLVENVRPASAVSKSTVFSFSEELSKMEANKRRDIQIVALYWKFKGFSVENKEQYQSALTRELRAAKNLKGYSDDQILATMRYLNKTATNYVWVLETINKRINEPIVYQPSDENLSEREYHTKYLSYDEETGQTYTYGNATEDEISPEELKIYKERIARHEAYLKENRGKPPKPINFKEIESDFKKPIDKITKKEDIYLITCQE